MSAYLLTCACGKTVPVELGQAGSQVKCACGAQLDVPTLRQLRHLPRQSEEVQHTGHSWSTRKGVVAACLIVAALLLGWSGWSLWSQPARPVFIANDYMSMVDQNLKAWTPKIGWQLWTEHYRPMSERGLLLFQASNAAEIESKITHARFLRRMLWSIAGIFAAVAIAGVFWPQRATKTRRQGDKEIRR